MLLWINGPFGVGKTQTAHELHRRLPGSAVCDPELIGFGFHRMLPPPLRGDFQDFPAWRQGVVEALDRVLIGSPGTTVIAPMTVVEPAYFAQTVGRLRELGHDVRHFSLLAHRGTVLARLRERVFGRVLAAAMGESAALRRESFAVSRLDLCLERLAAPEFAEHVWTDHLTVSQVAEAVAESAGLRLTPDTDGPLRARARRAWTGVRHIRFV